MWFFREDTATLLQHVALPIEFIGLALAIIEGARPDLARAIESWFDHVRNSDKSQIYLHRATKISIVAGIVVLLFSITFWLVLMFHLWNGPLRDYPTAVAVFGAITFLCVLIAVFYFAAMAPRLIWKNFLMLKAITNNRALGAIGLFLAAVGFATEVYQVAAMYLAHGATRPDWSWLPWI